MMLVTCRTCGYKHSWESLCPVCGSAYVPTPEEATEFWKKTQGAADDPWDRLRNISNTLDSTEQQVVEDGQVGYIDWPNDKVIRFIHVLRRQVGQPPLP